MIKKELKRKDVLFPELSYEIIGCAFDVYNELGSGYNEKYYQKALSESFSKKGLKFLEQVHFPLKYQGKTIGRNFLIF
jgi:GxxExxY protein